MRRFLFLLLGVMLYGDATFAVEATDISLERALREPGLMVSMRSNGGYCAPKGLSIRIVNASCRPYRIAVRPGLIFHPDEGRYQDLVIAAKADVLVLPDSQASVPVQTFCARSAGSGPAPGLRYTFMKKASPQLLATLHYMMRENWLNYTGQHAVWCFTDNHRVDGIYDANRPVQAQRFAAMVAKAKGVQPPNVYTIYKPARDSRAVFNPERDAIVVDLAWTAEPRNMRTHVYHPDGTRFNGARIEEHISKEGHRLHVVFPLATVPEGEYYVKVHDDENYVYAFQRLRVE